MDYYLLTELAAQLGYHLAMGGAETFRVEDTVRRVLAAYGAQCEVFAIPNCLIVSFEAANGKPLTLMKRIGFHGNDLESVEKFNALSRRICTLTPPPEEAMHWLHETKAACRNYTIPLQYLGGLLGGLGFGIVFGGSVWDSLLAGLLGLVIGFVNRLTSRLEANPFFSTIAASFFMAVVAYLAAGAGLADYVDSAIIGALMLLVPGLLITNSMRDIIYGDTNSGINRIVQVLLSAFAIALGTAAAWQLTAGFYGQPSSGAVLVYPAWQQALAVFVGCIGFAILYNVHSWGALLSVLGGVITWMVYLLCQHLGLNIYASNFAATVWAAIYSEIMARVRKCPVTPYLVLTVFPLLPGAGIYYTMNLGLGGSMNAAVAKGFETAGVAGSLAVGILLVSTLFRLLTVWRGLHRKNSSPAQ